MKAIIVLAAVFVSSFAWAATNFKSCPQADSETLDKLLKLTYVKQISEVKEITLPDLSLLPYVCNLPNLVSLGVKNVSELSTVVEAVAALPQIQTLSLHSSTFTSLCSGKVCPLASLKITELKLELGNYHDVPKDSLPQTLLTLNLASSNNPDKPGAKPFGDTAGIAQLINLQTLNVDDLYLQNLSFLRSLGSLTELHLYHNRLTSEHLAELVASPSAPNLSQVYLDDNLIEDVSMLATIAPQAWAKPDGFRILGNPIEICPLTAADPNFNYSCLPYNTDAKHAAALKAFLATTKNVDGLCSALNHVRLNSTLRRFAVNRCSQDTLLQILLGEVNQAGRERTNKTIKPAKKLIAQAIIKGFNVNASDANQTTLLGSAAQLFSLPMVKFLVGAGADKSAKDKDGATAYDVVQRAQAQFLAYSLCSKDTEGKVLCDGVPFDDYKNQLLQILTP